MRITAEPSLKRFQYLLQQDVLIGANELVSGIVENYLGNPTSLTKLSLQSTGILKIEDMQILLPANLEKFIENKLIKLDSSLYSYHIYL